MCANKVDVRAHINLLSSQVQSLYCVVDNRPMATYPHLPIARYTPPETQASIALSAILRDIMNSPFVESQSIQLRKRAIQAMVTPSKAFQSQYNLPPTLYKPYCLLLYVFAAENCIMLYSDRGMVHAEAFVRLQYGGSMQS